MKIRGNTVGTTMPRPDWEQTKPNKADFIHNKPDIDGMLAEQIDDATVSDKAWSSKNTVDKLCPTFEITDTHLTCEPLEGYPLEVVSHDIFAYDDEDTVRQILLSQFTNRSYFYSVDFSSITEFPVSYNWNTGVLETDSGSWWQYNLETKTFTEIEDRANYTPTTILTITAKEGENFFTANNCLITVKGRIDPNKYWCEKLAEQEAINADQEAQLAELNKQYELIEEVTLAEEAASFKRNKDTNGVPYDFSAIRVRVVAPAATAKAQIIFSIYAKDFNLMYHQQSEALTTSKTATNFVLRNDHGLVDYYCVTSAEVNQGNPRMRDGYIIRPWENGTSISLTTNPSSVLIPAGTTIKIYAVRG